MGGTSGRGAEQPVGTYLRRGAGLGLLLGFVTAGGGFLVGLALTADGEPIGSGSMLSPSFLVTVAAVVGLPVGSVVGLLSACGCLLVREPLEAVSSSMRTAVLAIVGAVVAGACTWAAARSLAELSGPVAPYVVIATLVGGLVSARTEHLWTRRQHDGGRRASADGDR